jgi:glycosyltransferase involved in cell wall biosynthesis
MQTSTDDSQIELSIIIKTLNEAKHIGRTISASRAAASRFRHEIIVADSLSDDDTAERALSAGARVIQLINPAHRSCGVGAQLGYQIARGRFVYLLDGDMECVPGFIDAALAYLNEHSQVAGVAGDMIELSDGSYEFELRKKQFDRLAQGGWHGDSPCLDGGGIFRREALEQVRFVTDRNLHAYEEKELGFRLSAAGWAMVRIPLAAVRHKGHAEKTWPLLQKRWRTKYVNGGGDLLRACLGTPYFWRAVWLLKQYVVLMLLIVVSLLALFMVPWTVGPLGTVAVAWSTLWVVLAFRKGGAIAGLVSLAYLTFWSVGMLRGVVCTRVDPAAPIPGRVR